MHQNLQKDTLITGGVRVTDTTITDVLQTSAIKAPVNSASGTIGVGSSGQVLTSDGTNTYWSSDILAVNDAMVFKGTLGTGGTITSVPTNGYSAGWTYRIITAGVYAGEYCEQGDLLIAINDGPATGSSIIAADWTRAQTNIDGPVFRKKNDNNSPDTFTTNRLIYSTSSGGEVASADNLYYDGTSLILQNDLNLYTNNNDRYINFTYYNNTTESEARWRLGYTGSGIGDNNVFVIQSTGSASNQKTFTNAISIGMNTHAVTINGNLLPGGDTQTKNIGSTDYKWNNIYGTLKGNADTATSAAAFTSAQSVTLTGDTTGSASSTAGWSITTKTDRLSTVGDNRSVATQPSDYSDKLIFQGLKTNSVIGSPSSDTYSYLIGLSGWTNTTGGNVHELAFNNSGIYWRNGDTTWNSWNKMASLKETGDLWADNQNATSGVATYVTLDITTLSTTNNRIFGTIKVCNYSSSTIFSGLVSFYFYWNKSTFSTGYYHDPTNSITSLTLIKDEDGKIYLKIQHSVQYVNFFVFVNSSVQKQGDNRAIAYNYKLTCLIIYKI